MNFDNLNEEELLMLDWAVYNEIERYIRQDTSKLGKKEQWKYNNLISLRQKLAIWVENRAKCEVFGKNG
tara:strand:- start:501 stop:707 length:207 start_codon:yes stop_codon:yes gene_type:complete